MLKMNNCNKCYYNSYLHDRYLINNCQIRIKYKDYKLKNILKLNIYSDTEKYNVINKLKILIIKRRNFEYSINNYLITTKIMCYVYEYYNLNSTYYYYVVDNIIKILPINQNIIEVNKPNFNNYYKIKIDNLNDANYTKYLHKWTLNNVNKKEYYAHLGFYKNCLMIN